LAEVPSICPRNYPLPATGSAAVGRLELDELAAEQLQVVWPEGMGAELLRIVATIYAFHKTVETYPGSCAASLVSAPKPNSQGFPPSRVSDWHALSGRGIGISLKRSDRLSAKNRMLARQLGSDESCIDVNDEGLAKAATIGVRTTSAHIRTRELYGSDGRQMDEA
jgi:hypothetical protein